MAVAVNGLQVANEFLHIVDVVVQVEFTVRQGHQTSVFPVGDVDLVVLQHGFDGVTQQGGVVARQRCHDQHGGLGLELGECGGIVRESFETTQLTERLVDLDALVHSDIGFVDLDGADAELWLFVVLAQAVHEGIASRSPLGHGRLRNRVQWVAVQLGCSLCQIGKRLHDRALSFKNLIKHVTVSLATKWCAAAILQETTRYFLSLAPNRQSPSGPPKKKPPRQGRLQAGCQSC